MDLAMGRRQVTLAPSNKEAITTVAAASHTLEQAQIVEIAKDP